ncbi:MAG: hypothetical protein IKS51_00570 [Erysipelotrichaceae bacterium]|nr:hypothetical protein [Erysipelotrichaceae bacterium]
MPQIKCEYCGSYIEETDKKCPYCNAVNRNFKRVVSGTPQTIEELKQWYQDRNLPPEEVTRFFIGKDIREARAFGIYRDGSDFIVYKNKDDGSRAIRYQGTDEAYAVNELYLKLKSEILNQKSRNLSRSGTRSGSGTFTVSFFVTAFISLITLGVAGTLLPSWIFAILGIVLFACVILFAKDIKKLIIAATIIILMTFTGTIAYLIGYSSAHKHDGYYSHGGDYYYFQGHNVYHYDNDDWYYYDTYDNFTEYYPDYYYVSDDYDGYEEYSDFSETEYYDDRWDSSSSSSSSSSDSDYDWDGGSDWDSGGTDWGSDW